MATRSRDKDDRATRASLKELRKDFERRMNDIEAEVEAGNPTLAEEAMVALRGEFEQRLSELRVQVDVALEPGRDAIRRSPITVVTAAMASGLVAGVVLGLLLGRGKKSTE